MPYSATAYQLLLSAPSDIDQSDKNVVYETVRRWNHLYGRQRGVVVSVVDWKRNAVPKQGQRPQDIINDQIVKDSDIVIALFWHRIGSPTGKESSGTVEEIKEAQNKGSYVAVLQCMRPYPPGVVDTSQLEELQSFIKELEGQGLVGDFEGRDDLAERVDAILHQATAADQARAETLIESSAIGAEVRPRLEVETTQRTDTKGRLHVSKRWLLVLANVGKSAAQNVRVRLEPEEAGDAVPKIYDNDRPVEKLPAEGEVRFLVLPTMGTASQVRCVLNWEEELGERESITTLRFV